MPFVKACRALFWSFPVSHCNTTRISPGNVTVISNGVCETVLPLALLLLGIGNVAESWNCDRDTMFRLRGPIRMAIGDSYDRA